MQKLSDFVADYLARAGLTHVFMLTGGGAMHLNESFGKHPALKTVFNHHEQSLAMAAESYARLIHRPAIVNVTTGPGGLNTLNGVFGAWVDSLPMIVISGQVRFDTTTASLPSFLKLRQLGDQECNIIEMVKGITKYAVMVSDPNRIQYHMEKALFLATTNRPGPVWLDIPMNVQSAFIDVEHLACFNPKEESDCAMVDAISSTDIDRIIECIDQVKRPVILAGSGVRLSGMQDVFLKIVDTLSIPVVIAWNAHDLLYDAHPYHCGRPGTVGDRCGNFVVQNADLLLILGSRLNIRQISYNTSGFAPYAFKIMVDVDVAELRKPTVKVDFAVHANLANFMPRFLMALKQKNVPGINQEHLDWLAWCRVRKEKYPVLLAEQMIQKNQGINPYFFMQCLSECLPPDQIIVAGDGTACVVAFQVIQIKAGQRLYTNSGCASMGYDLPAAIGAAVAAPTQDIVCLAGDGSIMQNIQELSTIAFNAYPIKIFLLNNNGYHSIRQTQQHFFSAPCIGVGPESGLGFPDFKKLMHGFGLAYDCCTHHHTLVEQIQAVLAKKGPVVCEVLLDTTQSFMPKLASRLTKAGKIVSAALDDMAPFLSREELEANRIDPCVV